jgi:hypothetical protein
MVPDASVINVTDWLAGFKSLKECLNVSLALYTELSGGLQALHEHRELFL